MFSLFFLRLFSVDPREATILMQMEKHVNKQIHVCECFFINQMNTTQRIVPKIKAIIKQSLNHETGHE